MSKPPFHDVDAALYGAEQAMAKIRQDEWTSIDGTGIRGEVQDVLGAIDRLRRLLKEHGLTE